MCRFTVHSRERDGDLTLYRTARLIGRVKVAVTDELGQPYRECRIALLSIVNKRVLNDPPPDLPYLDAPRAKGTFITTFILPPGRGSYLLRVACEGTNETFTSEPTVLPNPETSFPTPFDLGIIQLKQQEKSRN